MEYLSRLVDDDVTGTGREVLVRGTHAKLARTVLAGESGHRGPVSRFVTDWLPIVAADRTLCIAPSPEVRVLFESMIGQSMHR